MLQTTRTCSVCSNIESDTLPLADHKWEVIEEIPATCIEEGMRKSICSECHKEMVETIPLSDHPFERIEFVRNSCVSDGHIRVRCPVCSEELEIVLPKDSEKHSLVEKSIIPVTCSDDGLVVYECEICGYSEQKVIQATGHSFYRDKCRKCGMLDEISFSDYAGAGLKILEERDEWGEPTGVHSIELRSISAEYANYVERNLRASVVMSIIPSSKSIRLSFYDSNGYPINLAQNVRLRLRTSTGESETIGMDMYREINNVLTISEGFQWIGNGANNAIISELLSTGKVQLLLESGDENSFFKSVLFSFKADPVMLSRLIEEFGGTLILDAAGTSFTVPNRFNTIPDYQFSACFDMRRVAIPEHISSIGRYAFDSCQSLGYIEIPGKVTSIGDGAFIYCRSLTSIEIPDSVASIGSSAFESCTALRRFVIPELVTLIDKQTFKDCSNLINVEIPAGVTVIGAEAFRGCSSLTAVEIPASVTVIGEAAFMGCNNLVNVEIPVGVTEIMAEAFRGCSSLTVVEIPASVISIEDWAFADCDSLKTVVIYGNPTIGYDAFPDGVQVQMKGAGTGY